MANAAMLGLLASRYACMHALAFLSRFLFALILGTLGVVCCSGSSARTLMIKSINP